MVRSGLSNQPSSQFDQSTRGSLPALGLFQTVSTSLPSSVSLIGEAPWFIGQAPRPSLVRIHRLLRISGLTPAESSELVSLRKFLKMRTPSSGMYGIFEILLIEVCSTDSFGFMNSSTNDVYGTQFGVLCKDYCSTVMIHLRS